MEYKSSYRVEYTILSIAEEQERPLISKFKEDMEIIKSLVLRPLLGLSILEFNIPSFI